MIVTDEVRGILKQGRQRRLIEHALLTRGHVNVTDAWNGVYGAKIRRLGARILELRQDNWQIRTEEKQNGQCFYFLVAPPDAQMSLSV